MRVVWITHNYPRFAGDVAGAFLHPLAVALRQRGVDVRVVAPADAGQGGATELDGVPVRRVRFGTAADETLAYRGTMLRALRSPRAAFAFNRLRAALRAGATEELQGAAGAAVVHAHWWVPAGLAAPTGVPMVLTCHGTDVRLLDRLPPARWLARPVFRRARVVTTVSPRLALVLRRRMGCTVPDDAIQPMPVKPVDRPISDGSGGVVVLGRLSRQKRIDLAIDAAARARQHGRDWRLRIAGDGPERRALEARVARLGLAESVRFVGEVTPAQVAEVFATATCCVMPARDEGFGLAAAEALMQGVPVVACRDGGGLCDLVPAAGGGRLVAPDPDAIATAVGELLDDPGARDAARRAGEPWRERLDPAFVANRCLTWYRRALDA